jgi:transposase
LDERFSHQPAGELAMSDFIMAACDLHDRTLVLKLARGTEQPIRRVFGNDRAGREAMKRELLKRAQEANGARVVFAYEASSQGFGLCDELSDAGITCHVLAPTHLPRSPRSERRKNDGRDATIILEVLRGHLLAGNELPAVWVPSRTTRDDRELVRARLDAGEKLTLLKGQIQSLLKRHGLRWTGKGTSWTAPYCQWLCDLAEGQCVPAAEGPVSWGSGAVAGLGSLLRQLKNMEQEIGALDGGIELLANEPRYAAAVRRVDALKGVGLLTAMVFLTEIGELSRFRNRRQLAAYLGLVPSSNESGERSNCKGHITRQGPWRVRKVLCQAFWSAIRSDPKIGLWYERQVKRNPKIRKIAVVAGMRRLAIVMWRRGLSGDPPEKKPPQPTDKKMAPKSRGIKQADERQAA